MLTAVDGLHQIVPTHVGVNRPDDRRLYGELYCPHARGGEPTAIRELLWMIRIVPTHVGVNRSIAF